MTIYLFFHGIETPSGGTKVLFDIAAVLKSIGFDTKMLVPQNRTIVNINWFKHDMEIINGFDVVTKDDIVIMPEETLWAFNELIAARGCKYIMINQGAYWTLVNGLGHSYTKEIYSKALGVYVNSEYTKFLVNKLFGDINQYIFSVPIEPSFKPAAEKENIICYMPRKNCETAECVAQYVRGVHTDWNIIPVNNMSNQEVSDLFAKSRIFLSFGGPEGLGMPPIEAALAGCKVIGYHGFGGKEYFIEPLFTPLEYLEIPAFIDQICIYTSLLKDKNPLDILGAQSQRQRLEQYYSYEKFKKDIINSFSEMMCKVN